MAPYFSFVLFLTRRFPSGHWPLWASYLLAAWFTAVFCALLLLISKLRLKRAQGTVVTPQQAKKTRIAVWLVRLFSSGLVIIWTVFFCMGAKDTLQGKYSLSHAIPAGAFLLFFILLIGWSVYRSFRPKVLKALQAPE
jgi:hypothetical protein